MVARGDGPVVVRARGRQRLSAPPARTQLARRLEQHARALGRQDRRERDGLVPEELGGGGVVVGGRLLRERLKRFAGRREDQRQRRARLDLGRRQRVAADPAQEPAPPQDLVAVGGLGLGAAQAPGPQRGAARAEVLGGGDRRKGDDDEELVGAKGAQVGVLGVFLKGAEVAVAQRLELLGVVLQRGLDGGVVGEEGEVGVGGGLGGGGGDQGGGGGVSTCRGSDGGGSGGDWGRAATTAPPAACVCARGRGRRDLGDAARAARRHGGSEKKRECVWPFGGTEGAEEQRDSARAERSSFSARV